jgi:predicted transcriptional regulator
MTLSSVSTLAAAVTLDQYLVWRELDSRGKRLCSNSRVEACARLDLSSRERRRRTTITLILTVESAQPMRRSSEIKMNDQETSDLTSLTVDLLSAYLGSHNNVRAEDLPRLISSTHAALAGLKQGQAEDQAAPATEEHVPAVSARKSLSNPDFIISMIDGKPYKTLKRHLGRHGLTPQEYRERFNLPASYPMVAKGYSEQRRDVAKRLGLGRKRGEDSGTNAEAGAAVNADASPTQSAEAAPAPKARGRGRPKKAEADAASE